MIDVLLPGVVFSVILEDGFRYSHMTGIVSVARFCRYCFGGSLPSLIQHQKTAEVLFSLTVVFSVLRWF